MAEATRMSDAACRPVPLTTAMVFFGGGDEAFIGNEGIGTVQGRRKEIAGRDGGRGFEVRGSSTEEWVNE